MLLPFSSFFLFSELLFHEFSCSNSTFFSQINPLAETSDNKLVAADAKLNFDDNAAFRQKEIFTLRDPTQEDPREVCLHLLYFVNLSTGFMESFLHANLWHSWHSLYHHM